MLIGEWFLYNMNRIMAPIIIIYTDENLPQLSKASSFRRCQRILHACFNILSLASVLVTLKLFSSSIMESTLKQNKRARVKKLMFCKMRLTKVYHTVSCISKNCQECSLNDSKKKLREKIRVLLSYGDSQNPV